MQFPDDVLLVMAKERAEEAMRIIGQTRALRRGRVTRRPLRVRLGTILIRLGHHLMGEAIRDPELSPGA